MRLSPVHIWTAAKTGLKENLTPASLVDYQMERLRETVAKAKRGSYYAATLKNVDPAGLTDLEHFRRLPFTTEKDIQGGGYGFLGVSQSIVSRIITLDTSGTQGRSKRIFFTENDLELCVDFFAHGMTTMIAQGDKVGIFLGPEIPGGTVDLLNKALRRIGAWPGNYDFQIPGRASLDENCARSFQDLSGAGCLVGLPVNLLQLARTRPELKPKQVLLCSDYAPSSIIGQLEKIWGCEVFNHYGSTESGLGGGVECRAHQGYHLRDADLFFEVIDPLTGRTAPPGRPGEVVFTTLNREAMPLIRYRTGDLAALIESPCPCGSSLVRLSRIAGRCANFIPLDGGGTLSIHRLDEIMFARETVYDYRAVMPSPTSLNLTIYSPQEINPVKLLREVEDSLKLSLTVNINFTKEPFTNHGAKRLIAVAA